MKTLRISLIMLLLAGTAFSIQSCKKDKAEEEETAIDDSASQTQQSQDEASQTTESEKALDDVNTAVAVSGFGKGDPIVGATIDSLGPKLLKITYAGNNADGSRIRTGEIKVELTSGNKWKDQGAVITVTFTNFKVTRKSNNKSLTLTGVHMITNTSGGLAVTLAAGESVTHQISGNTSVTFEDGTQRTWIVSRQRKISRNTAGNYEIEVSGTGNGGTVVAGTNRAGVPFSTVIVTPVVFRQEYDWLPVSGVKHHKGIAREITVTFGVDQAGNPVSGAKPYGYRIQWNNNKGQAKTAVISY